MTNPAPLNDQAIKEWLSPIEDPEIRMSLTELGLIYSAEFKDNKAEVQMTLTTPTCPAADYILKQVKDRLLEHEAIQDAEVKLVWQPKWDPKTMASEEAKEKLGIW